MRLRRIFLIFVLSLVFIPTNQAQEDPATLNRQFVEAAAREATERRAGEFVQSRVQIQVRNWSFREAIRELDAHRKGIVSPALQRELEEQSATIHRFEELRKDLIQGIADGRLGALTVELSRGRTLQIVDANRRALTGRFRGGQVVIPWSRLRENQKIALLWALPDLSPDGWIAIARLCRMLDRTELADLTLGKLLKRSPDSKQQIDPLLAHWRDVQVPRGGFRLWKKRFVTAEEYKHLKRGLVRAGDRWVTRSHRRKLVQGYRKINGRWVRQRGDALRADGRFRLGKTWYSKESGGKPLGDWSKAITVETEHYVLQSNASPFFLKRLSVAMEDAYRAYVEFFGKDPRPNARKMRLLAFGRFEDYRAYCHRIGKPQMIATAAGFAPSEPNTACAYSRTGENKSFFQTLVHEAAHLYEQRTRSNGVTGLPSWVGEGIACYFEGFEMDPSGRLDFHHRPDDMVSFLKLSVEKKPLLPLKQIVDLNAIHLLHKDPRMGTLFYCQSWSLVYYFLKKAPAPQRKAFQEYFWKLRNGVPSKGLQVSPDLIDPKESRYNEFIFQL